jgi:hypothetical protein
LFNFSGKNFENETFRNFDGLPRQRRVRRQLRGHHHGGVGGLETQS